MVPSGLHRMGFADGLQHMVLQGISIMVILSIKYNSNGKKFKQICPHKSLIVPNFMYIYIYIYEQFYSDTVD